MKLIKKILSLPVFLLLTAILISCGESTSSQDQQQIQQIQNMYFTYPLREYPIGKTEGSQNYWECSDTEDDNYFGNYLGEYKGQTFNGFHCGEDWNLKGGEPDIGKPVYAIGKGTVIAYESLTTKGHIVVIEHTGTCIIPAKTITSQGQTASYKDEIVGKIYSVYLHLSNVKVKVGDQVDETTELGYIMDPGGGPHLHFEIRKNNDGHDTTWSLIGNPSNWQNGYYKDLQKMLDAGLRDPSDFIEANKMPGKAVIASPQTIPEASVSIETKTAEDIKKSSKIAYTVDDGSFPLIYFTNEDGTDKTLFKEDAHSPAFSPDGKRIAYVQHGYNEGDKFERREIRVSLINGLDDKKVYEVGGGKEYYTEAPWLLTWSHDSNGIFFQETPWDSEIFNGPIQFLDLSTLQIKELDIPYYTEAFNRSYDIQKIDGSIAYIEEQIEGIGNPRILKDDYGDYDVHERYQCKAWIVAADQYGKNKKKVFGPVEGELAACFYSRHYPPSYYIIGAPRWSPDGEKIAFLINEYEIIESKDPEVDIPIENSKKESILAIIDINGSMSSNFKVLYNTNDYISDIAWSPDGEKIAITERWTSKITLINSDNSDKAKVWVEEGSSLSWEYIQISN